MRGLIRVKAVDDININKWNKKREKKRYWIEWIKNKEWFNFLQ